MRGIAHAGALSTKPESCKPKGIAGTSAGAIVAAFVAAGYDPDKLKTKLSDPDLFSLLREEDLKNQEVLSDIFGIVGDCWPIYKPKNYLSLLWRLRKYKKFLNSDFKNIIDRRGIHSTSRIREWVNDALDGKKFADLDDSIDLRIVAANLKDRRFLVFNKKENAAWPIADAIQASVSIPFFFEPFRQGGNAYVDGGVLSNFPSYVFGRAEYPIIGFRLSDFYEQHNSDLNEPKEYLKALLETMMESHDELHQPENDFYSVIIRVPSRIGATKFDLSKEEVNELYQLGAMAGGHAPWSRAQELPFAKDPTLHFVTQQASLIYNAAAQDQYLVEELTQKTIYKVTIESNGSAKYHKLDEFSLRGDRVFILRKQAHKGDILKSVEMLSRGQGGFVSYFEIDGASGNKVQMPIIPAINEDNEKGFIQFFLPPIKPDAPPRKFTSEWVIENEFRELGYQDKRTISISNRCKAQTHNLDIQLTIKLSKHIYPRLEIVDEYGAMVPSERETDDYNIYVLKEVCSLKTQIPR